MLLKDDTIAAISSATGGAIAVIRLSGKDAFRICLSVWKNKSYSFEHPPIPRKMLLGKCKCASIAGIYETACAVFFKGPESYTGEDMAEIYCHGGALIAGNILKEIISCGARQAEPGEFTYRAFVNGKMDLSQAEAVADLINAKTQLALEIAERHVHGELKKKTEELHNRLTELISKCEVELDFSEENEIPEDKDLIKDIDDIITEISGLIATEKEGMLIRDGIRIVIAGHPNAGKSSLFNCLLGKDRAIVTDIAGTTRDSIEAELNIGGIPATLIDTAGIREADEIIERLGIERSKKSIISADMVLWVLDPMEDHKMQIAEMMKHCRQERTIAVWNKADLLDKRATENLAQTCVKTCLVSAKKNININELKNICLEMAGFSEKGESPKIAVTVRQADALKSAEINLERAKKEILEERFETATLFLRQSLAEIGKISGKNVSPDILDIIFSKFCIGK